MRYWTGCSGWQYSEWIQHFYPTDLAKKGWFPFYCEHFKTVEINYSFYRFPSESTVMRWKEQAPSHFRYSLKANRSITHYHRFHLTQRIINDFYKLSDLLEEKLGCILFQLPKNIYYDLDFLKKIIKQLSKDKTNVLEFQHESWWQQDVIDFLKKHNIIFANINSPIIHQPFQDTGNICYLRFHGEEQWYSGLYGEKWLETWLTPIQNKKRQTVWCYFDNTADGSAVKDAKTWQKLTSEI